MVRTVAWIVPRGWDIQQELLVPPMTLWRHGVRKPALSRNTRRNDEVNFEDFCPGSGCTLVDRFCLSRHHSTGKLRNRSVQPGECQHCDQFCRVPIHSSATEQSSA